LAARDDCRSVAMRGDGFCEVLRDRMGEKRWLSETGIVSLNVCKARDEGVLTRRAMKTYEIRTLAITLRQQPPPLIPSQPV
jgi:hypothetical protein